MKYFLSGLLLLISSITDFKRREISGVVLLIFFPISLLYYLFSIPKSVFDILGRLFVGFFILLCAYVSRESIGYGDGLIMIITGILLGGYENLELLLLALFLSSIFGLAMIIIGKQRKVGLPFVPFLFVSLLIERIL